MQTRERTPLTAAPQSPGDVQTTVNPLARLRFKLSELAIGKTSAPAKRSVTRFNMLAIRQEQTVEIVTPADTTDQEVHALRGVAEQMRASRRGVIAAATCAGATMALSAVPAIATPVEPDSELSTLHREWHVSEKAAQEAYERVEAAYERYTPVPPPEALFRRGSDFQFFWGFTGTKSQNGRLWYGDKKAIDYLREAPLEKCLVVGGPELTRLEPDAPARARRDEIVHAYDQWLADIRQARDDIGLTKAEEISERLMLEARALRTRIAAVPATTLAGLLLKAEIFCNCHGGKAEVAESRQSEIDEESPSDRMLAFNIATDLVAMLGHEVDDV